MICSEYLLLKRDYGVRVRVEDEDEDNNEGIELDSPSALQLSLAIEGDSSQHKIVSVTWS
jgi:hypothetical protein